MEINSIRTHEELEFAIFCIENIAIRLDVSAEKIYEILAEKSDILSGYIVPNYEVLHTQGKDYIIEDILEVMEENGVKLC